METRRHIEELQTLRGFAALLVALSRLTTVYAVPGNIRNTIDALLNAHAAVIIFFILSGYVLTGSLVRRGLGCGPVVGFYVGRFFVCILRYGSSVCCRSHSWLLRHPE